MGTGGGGEREGQRSRRHAVLRENGGIPRIGQWMDKTKSEQQVLDCGTSRSGCQGGWPNQAWDWGEVHDSVLGRFVPILSRVVLFERLLGRVDDGLHLEAVKCQC